MWTCGKCGVPLGDARLPTHSSGGSDPIEYLVCAECGYENLVTGWIHPRAADPLDSGYLLYNERTGLFDEYNDHGFLLRANVITGGTVRLPKQSASSWPAEKLKPKRSGSEMWLDGSGSRAR